MSLDPILQTYLFPLIGLIFLTIFILSNSMLKKRQTILFLVVVMINVLLIVATSLDYIFAGMGREGYFWLFRRMTTFLNFAAGPLIPLMLYKIFDEKKSRPWLYVPLILNIGLCLYSCWSGIVFMISNQNAYGRGSLFFVPMTISVFYILMLTFKPVQHHVRSKKIERYFLFALIALLALGMTLEIGFRFRFMDWTCSALGLILYYLLLNIQSVMTDPLTNVYNRLVYIRKLSSLSHKSRYLITLIDLNDFKQLNDTMGHAAGDRCLISFVDVLGKNISSRTTLYRVGGDEFALIAKDTTMAEFAAMLEKARSEVKKAHNIEFAAGTVEYTQGQDIDTALKQADARMYENKNQMKQ